MSAFTIRVELHHASTREDYDNLHGYMASEGCRRILKASDGKWYHLPSATYDLQGSYTRQQALDKAKRAAARTGKTYSILVTESNGRQWVGLPVVNPATVKSY